MTTKSGIDDKYVEKTAKKALKDEEMLSELLDGLLSKNSEVRFERSYKTLLFISENHPEALYPRWDFIAGLIDRDNAYVKYIGIFLLANLSRIDSENRFKKISDKYLDLINDKSVVAAGNLAGNLGKLALAKPELQTRITNTIINIDKTRINLKHNDLIKSYAIESFDQFFDQSRDKKKIIGFVRKQLKAQSPKTRKAAKEFLKKWEGD